MIILSISILSGIIQFTGYLIYARKVVFGSIRPNAASWSVWAFGAVIESVSYIYLSQDILKNILPIVCALSAILLFLMCLIRGYFTKITSFETAVVVADVIITIIWALTGSPFVANVLLVLTAVISFVPIITAVYKNPTYERAFPWFVWTVAYVLQLTVVIARFEKPEDLLYPIVFAILHIVVALLALDIRKKGVPDVSQSPHPEHV